jgi:hypothetical protein
VLYAIDEDDRAEGNENDQQQQGDYKQDFDHFAPDNHRDHGYDCLDVAPSLEAGLLPADERKKRLAGRPYSLNYVLQLVAAVIDWVRARNVTSVHLWLTEKNQHARILYERCGFSPTDERQPLPTNPDLTEVGNGPVAVTGAVKDPNSARTPSSRTGRRPVKRPSASAAACAITAASEEGEERVTPCVSVMNGA